MPTKKEREYYQMGFADGRRFESGGGMMGRIDNEPTYDRFSGTGFGPNEPVYGRKKPKRKLSAWQKFVKANSKKPMAMTPQGKLQLDAEFIDSTQSFTDSADDLFMVCYHLNLLGG